MAESVKSAAQPSQSMAAVYVVTASDTIAAIAAFIAECCDSGKEISFSTRASRQVHMENRDGSET
jgi:hypothetical protein